MTTPHPPHTKPRHNIPALKERLLIPEVWQKLGLEGQPGTKCRSPFREDKTPSFSIFKDGKYWKDYGTGAGGDVIDFIAMARQIDTGEALRVFLEMAGVSTQNGSSRSGTFQVPHPAQAPRPERPESPAEHPDGLRIPLQRGSEADRQLLVESRHISMDALSLGLVLRTLTFSILQGYRCWMLTDAEGRCIEARRLDGMPFPECGPLARRKAHTLRGSRKSWPVGVAVLRRIPDFRTLLLVEGGPDYLAALHFSQGLERWDVLPVAMLGRGTGTKIDPAALELMRGRRVRIYPHNDADGGGVKSARIWATQLHEVGCVVDIFDFAPLHRADGKSIKDLNDCTTELDDASTQALAQGLFPAPDLEVLPTY